MRKFEDTLLQAIVMDFGAQDDTLFVVDLGVLLAMLPAAERSRVEARLTDAYVRHNGTQMGLVLESVEEMLRDRTPWQRLLAAIRVAWLRIFAR